MVGRRTLLTLPNGVGTEYEYDAASRLTALIYRNATGLLGDLRYQYDPAGNRLRMGGSFARTLLPDPVATATYDAANRQLAFGDKAMTFDASGNVTAISDPSGLTSLDWDARDRLVALAGPGTSAAFAYDVQGRRLTRQSGGQLTQYLYDGLDVLAEVTDQGVATYLRTLTIDEPLARNGMEFYTADALGSALMLTDSAGALATRYTYAPFGRTAAEGVSSGNPFQYTGRENDGLAGLYYYRARYYYPGLGRFISEDPFQLAAGNLYAYVENSPLRFRDPFGLEKCSETSGTVLRDPLKYLGRFPDYVTLSIFPRQLRRFGFSISIDQRGNVFVGGGASFERNYSLMAGWVARSDYRERSVEDLLTGVTVTGTIARRGLGGGVSASSSCAAVELGVSSGSGVSATYGKKTVNILDWLGL